MKKKNDKNVATITRSGELTPLELWEKRAHDNAQLVRCMHETLVLIEKLEEAKELQEELPMPYEALEKIAVKALAGIAQELEARFGISA